MKSEWEGLESNIQLVVIYNFTARWEKFLHNVALRNTFSNLTVRGETLQVHDTKKGSDVTFEVPGGNDLIG